jgi:tRNA modification GTPase
MNNNQDTICALSTPNGIGAIALIRISGRHSFEFVSSIFSKNILNFPSHSAHFGKIINKNKQTIDEVLVTVFKEGKSFTGENCVEISCHGSLYIQQQILNLLLESGCRMAQPGEFTMRAFLNGKMDLSQAEAVADLISSQTKVSHEIAMNQMRGVFSNKLKDLREKLIHFASLVELELDFAEEDVEFADRTQLNKLVIEVLNYIKRLIHSFELGNVIKNGVPVAIVGAPNTGKSTLLNQLLGEERAIVSKLAGTTRDAIEEVLNIDGILFRLIDTAGIRENPEEIEAIGIKRSHEKIKQAKIVLVLNDFSESKEFFYQMGAWASEIKSIYPEKIVAVLGNKIDLHEKSEYYDWNYEMCLFPISAKNGTGIFELKDWLVKSVTAGFDLAQDTIVSNVRHLKALVEAEKSLNQAKVGLEKNVTGDFIAMDIRQAMFHIGSITGDISSEDLLGNIFKNFCIGK